MTTFFTDFKEAQQTGDGRLLADTISPFGSIQNTQWLFSFAQLSTYQTVSADMRYHLLQDRSTKVTLPKAEGSAWVEIFVALWNTIKALLSVQSVGQQGKWLPVFKAYKELANLLIRGYSNHGFQAWTVPCLSAVGKYLRAFAMKADQEAKNQDLMTFGDGLQDDVVGNFGKNERLEEAAWVINRMFTICLSDRLGSPMMMIMLLLFLLLNHLFGTASLGNSRSPIEESRKWGIYSTTSLLFKTYFKVGLVTLPSRASQLTLVS